MAQLATLVKRLDGPPRRPRGPRRRRIRFSVNLDGTEFDVLEERARQQGLAVAAYLRQAALLEALRSREQERTA